MRRASLPLHRQPRLPAPAAAAAEFPPVPAPGDRPACRQRLLCGDGGRRQRRPQARRRGRDRGCRRLVREPELDAEHDIIRKATARDNVCIQPHDIDGDGRIDFALGAGWRPPDTKNPSTLQWLGRDARRPLAGPPDPLRRAHAAPPPLGRREGDGQEATRRRRLARTRHQGPELGGRRGRPCPRLRRSREARRARTGRSRSPSHRCTRSTTSSSST